MTPPLLCSHSNRTILGSVMWNMTGAQLAQKDKVTSKTLLTISNKQPVYGLGKFDEWALRTATLAAAGGYPKKKDIGGGSGPTESDKQILAAAAAYLKDGLDTPYDIYVNHFNRVIDAKASEMKFEWSVWFVCHNLQNLWVVAPEGKTIQEFLNIAGHDGGVVCRSVRATFADKSPSVQNASIQAVLEKGVVKSVCTAFAEVSVPHGQVS